jgi:hypothetical protein
MIMFISLMHHLLGFLNEVENKMAKQSNVRHIAATNVMVAPSKVPSQKRIEAAQILYIDRV